MNLLPRTKRANNYGRQRVVNNDALSALDAVSACSNYRYYLSFAKLQ
jgi:hypothetical protein